MSTVNYDNGYGPKTAELKTLENGKTVLVVSGSDSLASAQPNAKIKIDGTDRVIQSVGKTFRVQGARGGMCYVYLI